MTLMNNSDKSNPVKRTFLVLMAGAVLLLASMGTTSCKNSLYKFKDLSIPDTIRTVKINYFENRAPYINPQLSPRLTDAFRQKIVTQTRLSQTNDDNADWVIDATITNYSVTTSGVSQGQAASNRLTVTVHVVRFDQKANKSKQLDISRNFDFSANQSLTQAEAELFDTILKGMTDDMFNQILGDW